MNPRRPWQEIIAAAPVLSPLALPQNTLGIPYLLQKSSADTWSHYRSRERESSRRLLCYRKTGKVICHSGVCMASSWLRAFEGSPADSLLKAHFRYLLHIHFTSEVQISGHAGEGDLQKHGAPLCGLQQKVTKAQDRAKPGKRLWQSQLELECP